MSPYANPEDQRASDNRRYVRNRAERLFKGWERKLKNKYAITVAEYNEMLGKQNGACAICLRLASEFPRRLHVDHIVLADGSILVRGLLCFDCNASLGKFRDDPALILRAMEYVMAAQ